jgi:hypothetical protein
MKAAEATGDDRTPEWTQLRLLGTVHGDPRGFRRLRQFLQQFQPDLILVELSPYGLAFRQAHQRELQKTLGQNLRRAAREVHCAWQKALAHPEIRAIRRQIALPFEYRASHHYAQVHNRRLLLVDRSDFSQALVACWPDLISTSNLALLLTLPGARKCHAVESHYRRAHELLCRPSACTDKPRHTAGGLDEDICEERENSLAERVRGAILAMAPASCVYVGGWEHLADQEDPPSLRRLLAVPAAHCFLLDDYDPCPSRCSSEAACWGG